MCVRRPRVTQRRLCWLSAWRNFITTRRGIRSLAWCARALRKKTLAYLERLQATDDSFLASPLHTAFVVMSLASIGFQDHPIVERGLEFLLSSVHADASWSVGVNRSLTNTTFALESLSADSFGSSAVRSNSRSSDSSAAIWHDMANGHSTVSDDSTIRAIAGLDQSGMHGAKADEASLFNDRCLDWLLKSQRTEPNPLTDAAAGGWAHSDAPGALPNTLATAVRTIGAPSMVRSRCQSVSRSHRASGEPGPPMVA